MTTTETMKPSQEILSIAKAKAAKLAINQQIRVGGAQYEKSYWVFNFAGSYYIGTFKTDDLGPFFKTDRNPILTLTDKDGNEIGKLQKIRL